MMVADVRAFAVALPDKVVSNELLERELPDTSADQILDKTGIRERRIAGESECASDLAYAAAEKLIAGTGIDREVIDALIFCSQTPDYFLPSTSCLLQDRLGLRTSVAAMDVSLGCSGFVYCLGLAKGLIETGQACNVLILTADTYSKFLHPEDRSVRSLFGDAGAATLVQSTESSEAFIGPFVYGSDGSGASDLIVEKGGFRSCPSISSEAPRLFMDGPQIFHFTLKAVPRLVEELLVSAGVALDEVDLFVFHQANRFMLEHLRDKLGIPEDRFLISMDDCGNTVSSSIPIALHRAVAAGRVREGAKMMLVGFGVGYSWGATMLHWTGGAGEEESSEGPGLPENESNETVDE